MQRLNLKLVLWLGAAGLIAAVAMFFLHGFQMKRTAGVLLREAQAADEAEGDKRDVEKAVNLYGQYLTYRPEDTEAATKRAFLLAELAEESPEKRMKYAEVALRALEDALRNDTTNDEIRERLVDFGVYAFRPQDSIEHIKALLTKRPDDAELLAKLGTCLARTGNPTEGADTLRKAIDKGAKKVETYYELAVTLRRRELETEADKVIEDMVAANPNEAKAYLVRSQWLREVRRQLSDAETKRLVDAIQADINKALELEPDNADCLFAAAQMATSLGQVDKVKELMNKGHELYPKDERMVQMLVQAALKENKLDEVNELVKQAPDSVALKQVLFEIKLQGSDKEEARAILKDLEESKAVDPRNIEYMKARLLMADGKWLEATREFERLRASMPQLQVQIELILGRCYEVLKQSDKQLEVYKSALGNSPNSLEAVIGYGRALQANGNNAEALKVFKDLKSRMKIEDFVKLVVVRNALLSLLIEENSRLPVDQRKWTDIDEVMAASKAAFPDAADLGMIESKIIDQKGDPKQAKEMILKSLADDGKNLTKWLSLINLTFNNEGAAAAIKVIDDAQAALGDVYELRAMRISCGAELPPEDAKKALADGVQWIEADQTLKPEQKRQLRQIIGANYFRMHDFVEARKIWQQIADTDKDDQQALLVLFDIGINERDDAKVVETIKAIKGLLGADSPEAKYVDVRRNIALLRDKKVENPGAVLKEARKKIHEALEQRPRWNALPRVEAEIDMLENRPDEAIANLRLAIEYGATDYSVIRQLAELLTIRGRGGEAQQVLAEAQSRAPSKEVSATSELIEVSLALADNNVTKAIGLLEQAHKLDPNDTRKTVWLGQVLTKAARYDEAEALFREAVEKDPEFPTSWQELVKLLRDQRRETDGREVINLGLEKISKPLNEVIAGQCCELLGDIEGAEQHMLKARDEKPEDLGLTRALAMFYGRHRDFVKVRAELDRLMAVKPTNLADKEQVGWANREIAIMIAGRGTYTDLVEALKRLDEKDINDKATIAALLAGRPEAESRLKAVRLLQEVKATAPLTGESRLVLARLYDVTGDWPRAKDEMLSLVGAFKDDPKYIAPFVEMMIDHNDLGDAELWMGTLERAAPGNPITSAVKAKLLVKQGKPDQAVAVLRELLPRPMPKDMLPTLLQVAQLLESLKLNDAAEPMYREYSVLNPRGTLELAGFLGRHGSLKDALDLCESSLDVLPTDNVLRASIQILRDKQTVASKEDYDRVGKWISTASAKHPKSLLMKLIYAELLDLQQLYPELEKLYTSLLENPEMVGQQRAIVLNNLAFLLAVQNRPGDARKLIDEAVTIFGPTSDLLDTRAIVEIAQKDAKQAIADLELATVDQPTGSKYFHLAQAHLLNRDTQAATEALKKAVETYKLNRKELAPAEQPKFDSMVKELGITLDSVTTN